MLKNNEIGGRLTLNIVPLFNSQQRHQTEEPKQITIKDSNLKLIVSEWIMGFMYSCHLPAGSYVLSVDILLHEIEPKIINIKNQEETRVDFLLGFPRYSVDFFSESLITDSKSHLVQSPMILYGSLPKEIASTHFLLWTDSFDPEILSARERSCETLDQSTNYSIPHSQSKRKYLQIIPEKFPAQFICLPVDQDVNVFLKNASGPSSVVSPVQAVIMCDRPNVNTLLNLLFNGAITDAKNLFNAQMAEELLYNKRIDASGAAVGAYFLLGTQELDRLHDWTRNLDNWFPWLPDGSIIHAWHLIQLRRRDKQSLGLIRERLLEAVERGVPIYAEGLRLLHEGLMRLSYHYKQKDIEIETALDIVKRYVANADMSMQYTTFKGVSPSHPGSFPEEQARPVVSGGSRTRKK